MSVRMVWPRVAASLFVFALVVSPAAAQEAVTAPAPLQDVQPVQEVQEAQEALEAPLTLRDAIESAPARLEQLAAQPPLPPSARAQRERPAALMPLYASFIALQGMDVHSTTSGLSRGAAEANPFMKDVAGNPGALFAVKAASTAGLIYGVEKLRKKNRAAAIAVMIGLNVGMAYVVQHNYRVGKE